MSHSTNNISRKGQFGFCFCFSFVHTPLRCELILSITFFIRCLRINHGCFINHKSQTIFFLSKGSVLASHIGYMDLVSTECRSRKWAQVTWITKLLSQSLFKVWKKSNWIKAHTFLMCDWWISQYLVYFYIFGFILTSNKTEMNDHNTMRIQTISFPYFFLLSCSLITLFVDLLGQGSVRLLHSKFILKLIEPKRFDAGRRDFVVVVEINWNKLK